MGVDVESTYCYLLSAEEHRDETTWGFHLLELRERGLHPIYTIADGGKGLRAGQAAAWPDVPCHGDVFHAEREFGKLAYYLENHAASAVTKREKIENKMARAKKKGERTEFLQGSCPGLPGRRKCLPLGRGDPNSRRLDAR